MTKIGVAVTAMLLALGAPACSSRQAMMRDTGGASADVGATDGGARDVGSADTGETGPVDAAPRDAGAADVGPRDGGVHDAGALDAGHDAGSDAGHDAGSDAGSDAGPRLDSGLCPGGPSVGLYAADDVAAHGIVRGFLAGTGVLGTVTVGGPVVDDPGPPVVPARIPTLAELMAYDAVFVWGSGAWDGTALGNVLADYVDAGGGVAIAVFAQRSGSSVGVSGRMETGGYLAYVPSGYDFAALSIGTIALPSHPIMSGVSTFSGTNIAFHDGPIAAGATLVASWSNGRPIAATLDHGTGRTALLGVYPVRFWDTTSDGARMMANTLRWVAGCE